MNTKTPKRKRGRPPKDKTIQEQKKYAQIGTWLWDTSKKPPFKIEQPEALPVSVDKDLIREYITYYGLGYVIHDYVPFAKIADKKLAAMWEKCRLQLIEIIKYIYDT